MGGALAETEVQEERGLRVGGMELVLQPREITAELADIAQGGEREEIRVVVVVEMGGGTVLTPQEIPQAVVVAVLEAVQGEDREGPGDRVAVVVALAVVEVAVREGETTAAVVVAALAVGVEEAPLPLQVSGGLLALLEEMGDKPQVFKLGAEGALGSGGRSSLAIVRR